MPTLLIIQVVSVLFAVALKRLLLLLSHKEMVVRELHNLALGLVCDAILHSLKHMDRNLN